MRRDRARAAQSAAQVDLTKPFAGAVAFEARASIAAALGDKAQAVQLLRHAYPTGFRDDLFHYRYPALYEPLHGYAPFDAMITLAR